MPVSDNRNCRISSDISGFSLAITDSCPILCPICEDFVISGCASHLTNLGLITNLAIKLGVKALAPTLVIVEAIFVGDDNNLSKIFKV